MSTSFGNNINAELLKSGIRDAEFVKLTVPGATDAGGPDFYFSSSFKNEIDPISGRPWTALGGYVAVSGHQRDLAVTSYDTVITMIGMDPSKIGFVLEIGKNGNNTIHGGLKGSQVQIFRGFYNANYVLIDQPQLRYSGVVTSYVIQEDRIDNTDTFTISLHCSSYKTILENRLAGRFTNQSSWQNFESTDISMNRVASISKTTYPFGVKLA